MAQKCSGFIHLNIWIVLASAAHTQTFHIKWYHTQNTRDLIKIRVLKYTISNREKISLKIGLIMSFSNKQ